MADANLVNLFGEQFTEADSGWVFRERCFGPAVPVSADERALFVTGFAKSEEWRSRVVSLSSFAIFVPLVAVKLLWPALIDPYFGLALIAWAAACSVFSAIHDQFAVAVPVRALANRLQVAAAVDQRATGFSPSRSFGIMIWMPALSILMGAGVWTNSTSTSFDRFALAIAFVILAGAAFDWLKAGRATIFARGNITE